MRISQLVLALLSALIFIIFPGTKTVQAAPSETNYIEIIESSCKKSCVGGKDELSFCASYCSCVGRKVKSISKEIDILKVLKEPAQKARIANQCSGSTAVKFFTTACRDKCDGVEKCASYCSCIEKKVKSKRSIAQVGDFFIRLGKNDDEAKLTMQKYEQSCNRN